MLNAVLNLPGCHDTVCKLLPGKIVKITNKHRSIAKYPVNNTPHYWYQNFRKNSQFNLQKVFKQDIIYISGNPRLNEMSSTKSMCLQFDVGYSGFSCRPIMLARETLVTCAGQWHAGDLNSFSVFVNCLEVSCFVVYVRRVYSAVSV